MSACAALPHNPSSSISYLKQGVFFTVLGPLLGYLIVPVVMAICLEIASPGRPQGILSNTAELYGDLFGRNRLEFLLVAYCIGFIPAGLSGLTFQFLATKLNGIRLLLALAPIAFAISFIEMILVAAFFLQDIPSQYGICAAVGLCGAFAATSCQALSMLIFRRHDTGSHPRPLPFAAGLL